MKKHILSVTSLIISIILLSSCGNSDVLKTKEFSADIKQTEVVLKGNINENTDYEKFITSFSPSFTVPGLFEGVVPQGLCYSEELNTLIISAYYEEAAYPSVLMCVDAKSGKMTSYHPLKDTEGNDYSGHAGGLAASENHIFLTSDGEAETISITALKATKSGEPVKFESKFKLATNGAFATIANGILWTGDFIESSDEARESVSNVTTLDSGETFYAYCEGYILEDGLPSKEKINSDSNGYTPDYMLAIPEQVQGMAVTPAGKFFFATSYGRKNDSMIYGYYGVLDTDRIGTVSVGKQEVDLFACSNEIQKKAIVSPPMAEGMTSIDDSVYVLFESGASKYRNHGGKYTVDTLFTAEFE